MQAVSAARSHAAVSPCLHPTRYARQPPFLRDSLITWRASCRGLACQLACQRCQANTVVLPAPCRCQVTIGLPSRIYRQSDGLVNLGAHWASLNRVTLLWHDWSHQKAVKKILGGDYKQDPGQAPQLALCMPMLAGAPALEHLVIVGFVGASGDGVNALNRLRSLRLAGCWHGADEVLSALPALTRLTALELIDCRDITPAGMACVAALPALVVLKMADCRGLTPDCFRPLAGLNLVQDLEISDRTIAATIDLALLQALPALRRLDLHGGAAGRLAAAGAARAERRWRDAPAACAIVCAARLGRAGTGFHDLLRR